jgi:hypothetical protein
MNEVLGELLPYVYKVDLSDGTVQITLGMKHDEKGPYTECAVLKCPRLAELLHAHMSAFSNTDRAGRDEPEREEEHERD